MNGKDSSLEIKKRMSYLLLALTLTVGFVIVYFSKVQPIWYLLTIPSVIFCFEITGIVHELGHFITAKNCGFEVVYCAFPNFVYDKTAKTKIKFTLKGEYLGEIRFYPKTPFDYAEGFKKTLLGGIYAHIVIACVLNALLLVAVFGGFGAVSPILSVAFCYAPYSLYALIVNVVPWFHPENDGAMVKNLNGSRDEVEAVFNFYSIQKALFEGKSYCEISASHFSASPNVSTGIRMPLVVFALRRALESEDRKTADALADILKNEDVYDLATDCELLYKFILDGNEEMVREYEKVLPYAENENYPVVLKALLAHAKYRGDDEYFAVAKPRAIKVCEETEFCKGDAKYNKILIEKL
ncbi:MAG: hypothetical protein E7360_02175 [Clostridiales bacterium]|nr:hypothetical protein [Clostridiales bacterium]